MPAAESADPTPGLNLTDGAAVIPMQERRKARGVAPSERRRWVGVQTPPAPGGSDGPGRDRVLALLANDVETSLNEVGHSLTEDSTVEVYTHTLRLVDHMLRGAAEQGITNEEQRQELAVLVAGLMEAPRFV